MPNRQILEGLQQYSNIAESRAESRANLINDYDSREYNKALQGRFQTAQQTYQGELTGEQMKAQHDSAMEWQLPVALKEITDAHTGVASHIAKSSYGRAAIDSVDPSNLRATASNQRLEAIDSLSKPKPEDAPSAEERIAQQQRDADVVNARAELEEARGEQGRQDQALAETRTNNQQEDKEQSIRDGTTVVEPKTAEENLSDIQSDRARMQARSERGQTSLWESGDRSPGDQPASGGAPAAEPAPAAAEEEAPALTAEQKSAQEALRAPQAERSAAAAGFDAAGDAAGEEGAAAALGPETGGLSELIAGIAALVGLSGNKPPPPPPKPVAAAPTTDLQEGRGPTQGFSSAPVIDSSNFHEN